MCADAIVIYIEVCEAELFVAWLFKERVARIPC